MLYLAWKNLLYRKLRAVLTVIGVAAGVFLVIMLSFLLSGTEKAFVDSFGSLAGQVRIQPKSDVLKGRSTDVVPTGMALRKADVDKILETANGYDPAKTSPVLYQVLVPPGAPNMPPLMMLSAVEPGHEAAVADTELASGERQLTGDHDLILGQGALNELSKTAGHDLAVGDSVRLPGHPDAYMIKGILKEHDPYTDAAVVVPLATAQQSLNQGDTVTYVALGYALDSAKEASDALKESLDTYDVVTSEEMLESADKGLDAQRRWFRMIEWVGYITAGAVIFMVMFTSVMERTKEIGTMRAVGVHRFTIIGGILLEAVIAAVIGTVLAGAVGAWLCSSWGLVMGPTYYVSQTLSTMGTAAVMAVIASLIPAVRASRVDPLEALRYE